MKLVMNLQKHLHSYSSVKNSLGKKQKFEIFTWTITNFGSSKSDV